MAASIGLDTIRGIRTSWSRSWKTLLPLAIVLQFPGVVSGYRVNIAQFSNETWVPNGVDGILMLVSVVATYMFSAAITPLVLSALNGKEMPLDQAMSRAASALPALIGTGILAGLAIMGGTLLFIIPGIVIAIGLTVFVPVVVMENLSGKAALRRSWQLMDGNKLSVFLLSMAAGLAYVFISGGFGVLLAVVQEFGGATDPCVGAVGSGVLGFVFGLATSVLPAVVYHQLRSVEVAAHADHPSYA